MNKQIDLKTAQSILNPKPPIELGMMRLASSSSMFIEAPKDMIPLTPIEIQLRDLKYYTRRGRKLPEIPAEKKAEIDYEIAARNNEVEPSIPQQVQQIIVDYLNSSPLKLITVGNTWCGYLKPLLAYSFEKLMESDAYAKVEYLPTHPNGIYVASNLAPNITPIEIGYRKVINATTSGTYFLKWGSTPIVVSFDFANNGCAVSVTVPEENKAIAETFLSDFNRSCAENNIYKNQKLAMVQGGLKFIKIKPTKLENVYLPRRILSNVIENTIGVLENREQLLNTPLGICRSIITAGYPGTGKTQLFNAIANTAQDCTVIQVSSKAFVDSSDVSTLYAAARDLGPTLLILEDLDLIGSNRSSAHRDNQLLGELLTQMSGSEGNENIITVASTNKLSAIDQALADRPERFDRVIVLPLPGPKIRSRMIGAFMKEFGLELKLEKEGTWDQVLDLTNGFSGAYLKEIAKTSLVKKATRKTAGIGSGIVVVNDQDLLEATNTVRENYLESKKARRQKMV